MTDPIKAQMVDCKNCGHYDVCCIRKNPEFLGFVDRLNKMVEEGSDMFSIKITGVCRHFSSKYVSLRGEPK